MADDRQKALDAALAEGPYPFQQLLGYGMTAWDDGYSRFEMDLEDRHMNRYGIPHGGLYCVLLDTVMGYAGAYTGDPEDRQMVMTLSLNTSFVGRPTGTKLIVEGRRTGGGKSTYFSEGEVRDEAGTLVASGTGVFRYRKRG